MTNIDAHRNQHEFPRHFLPPAFDLGKWENIDSSIQQLLARKLETPSDIETWLGDLSELQAAVSEEFSSRYIKMTCHTDDPTLEQAYLDYVENIMPRTETAYFELNKKYLAADPASKLSPDRYSTFTRSIRNSVEIFRDENVPLQTQDEILSQKYQKVCGEMTVQFDGREQTLPQMARYLEETDRERRREAWKLTADCYLKNRDEIESIFDQMLELRNKEAANAGFPSFIDFQFRRLGRFDYAPQDCYAFHHAVETIVMPLQRELRERRRQQMELQTLAPYDLDVDPLGRPPLRPFETPEQLGAGAASIFSAVDQRFLADFDVLRTNELLDLDSRKGKAPGGYQSTLDEARLPFIFMNAAGRNRDVFTLLHEGGHAFHALASRDEPLLAYRGAPIEFCEVASMGMEMMACERLTAFYDAQSAFRARQVHLEDVLVLLPWIARVDAFQHWIYTHPGHTRNERRQQWLELDKRFGPDVDWSELPEWRECSWIKQLHFFCVPLYYIEYGIAQLGALQLWARYLDNPEEAVKGYRAALALGGAKPLPTLFETAGLKFKFDAPTVAPLAQRVRAALKS